jgi:hypothetical protein
VSEVITEAVAIVENYTFLRPLAIVLGVAVVVFIACFVALQRAGRNQ